MGRDKKGRPIKEDMGDIQAAGGHGAEDYTAYVFYQFEVA